MIKTLRTKRDGTFGLRSNSWGQYLTRVDDPDANVEITKEQLTAIELHDDIQRIPADLWQRWIQLCFHFVKQGARNVEVSCRLLRCEEDPSQWRILVPPQEVSSASVRADTFDGAIDIVTGETCPSWPPDGWLPAGSSHSHNTMEAFFSGTDDKYELGDPGLHIVVGSIDVKANRYTLKASVTASRRRFDVPYERVVDATPVDVTFHPDVLTVVQLEVWPRAIQGYAKQWNLSNYGNGYTTRFSKRSNNVDLLPPWHEDQWHAHSNIDKAADDIDTLEVEAAIDALMTQTWDNAPAGQQDQAVAAALFRIRNYLDQFDVDEPIHGHDFIAL